MITDHDKYVINGEDVETKKLCALKKIEVDDRRKSRTKEAIQKEANILSQLKHPHIVSFHESFYDQEFVYIVQDYCDGGSLDEKIQEAKEKNIQIEEKEIMCWFVQMTMAVQYIHLKKVLHRDLKTENIFLTKSNVAKIGDFGISKVLESPEVCQEHPYSSKSDIWALGCVLYELCALDPPFDAQNLISLFFKIIKGEFIRIPSRYSDPLNDLVQAMLKRNPDERPSASQILSLPFVKKHLADFIEEKQSLLQQKSRDSSNGSLMNQSNNSIKPKGTPRSGNTSMNHQFLKVSPAIKRKVSPSRSPQQKDSGLSVDKSDEDLHDNKPEADNMSDYSDDFDEVSDEEENKSKGSDQEVEYDDDFEEYDSSEELDELVNQAKEVQEIEVEEDFFADSQNLESIKKQTVIFRRTCMDAISTSAISTRCKRIQDVNRMISDGTLTEDDLKQQVRHSISGDAAELCHLSLDDL
ncbi:Serine/threonine-protein kinase Nek2,Probable serine/threonine-protein kinase nek3,Serine/threonine-protein kinase Nek1,Serine/threonine-protein kinase Nek8,Serine/threonine-protein kinase Nek3,Serine/threonine-protein kinase Nek4 [Mytilus coruscus]|uniref:non-specific serine/threonine protein kinase n=1 Tax=Mytilus coruscus TaxID=42192 RepID=A0A6J8DSA3_MYTCO|nr:Serine/threonine-protein kinase Nek2,Probable serine/threonine-protein kinase nek3,Serine/threonine-protein kinase Nek1,Serine/threonine-protein kinase Nek8,Serine/threonine-protein kinase Nek3,Serine/threonine-protein kinase Nek4 [Mytilus coruscus]